MSSRCSPTEAVNLLRRYSAIGRPISPMTLAKQLTDAVNNHDNEVFRLWCDGVLVEPHIRAIARVVPMLDKKEGRWTADIESTGPGLGWARGLNWEFDVDEVVALLPPRRGVKPHNWEIHTTLELERLGRKAALDLHNSGELVPHLKHVLQREIGFVPKHKDALPSIISAFLHPSN